MSSLQIVRDIRALVEAHLTPAVPKRWRSQFDFGMQAFALRPFTSAGSNARQVVANAHTAGTKTDRLLSNQKLGGLLGAVFDALGLVRQTSFVNVDHTDMNGLMALAGAVQTRQGRAIPAFTETTYSDRLPAGKDVPKRKRRLRQARVAERAEQKLTWHTIRSLKTFIRRLGFSPRFVFDRGFCSEKIIRFLLKREATFYIRMKASKLVGLGGATTTAGALPGRDTTIQLYGTTLRVIRSRRPKRETERWLILTNDLVSTAGRVLRIYYHRFEIEETFKDMKHLLGLKRTRLDKPASLKVLLWFVSLGIALLYLATRDNDPIWRQGNLKKWISWLRAAYEQLERAITELLWKRPLDVDEGVY